MTPLLASLRPRRLEGALEMIQQLLAGMAELEERLRQRSKTSIVAQLRSAPRAPSIDERHWSNESAPVVIESAGKGKARPHGENHGPPA